MKKSTIATVLVFFLLIPATLYIGTRMPGKSYYLTATLMIIEMLIPFFLAFEGRKPQARELVVLTVMCAIAIVSRIAIPIPHFKPTFAVIMLSGIAFGPQSGFIVGAVTAFASNFFELQGPYTPWQMMAYGAGGLAAGFFAQMGWLSRKPWQLAVFGFFAVVLWVGPMLDVCSFFLMPIGFSLQALIATLLSGLLWVNVSQGLCTALTMLFFSRPLLEKLDRIKVKYGMMEAHDGL